MQINTTLKRHLFYLLGALILMVDAFYNGYPIIYQDTSTYIANGFDIDTPIDRPITYCLFVRMFSLNGLTLWTVVLAQSYLLSFVIFKLMDSLFGKRFIPGKTLLVIAFLSLLTGVSWTTSQVIADIFTPIMVIVFTLILIRKSPPRQQFFLYFLFLLSTSMHLSHIMISLVMITLLFIFRLLPGGYFRTRIKARALSFLLIMVVLSFFTMNSSMAKSRHIFLLGAMAENGVLEEMLHEECQIKDFRLCAFKDSLPEKGYDFVWNEDSPVYRLGGWKAVEEEFNDIILTSLFTPKYIWMHIKGSMKATWRQLTKFRINDANRPYVKGDLVYERMEVYFPGELQPFLSSKQNRNEFGFTDLLNKVYNTVFLLSLAGIVLMLVLGRINQEKLILVFLIFLISVLVNAWVAATFANSIDRLGCKMAWLIPLLLIIGAIGILSNNQKLDQKKA